MPRKTTLKSARDRARKAMSLYIRKKHSEDGYCKCVSCGTMVPFDECDAGHFIPKGRSALLEFEEENVWPECIGCNRFNDGHLVGYTLHMIDTYGRDKVEEMQNERGTIRRRKQDYLDIESYYKRKLAEL